MTLTLELSPEVEAELRAKAERAGQDVGSYITGVLTRFTVSDASIEALAGAQAGLRPDSFLPGAASTTEAARLAAIDEGMGKFTHLGISSADVRREREKDKEREERFNGSFGRKAA